MTTYPFTAESGSNGATVTTADGWDTVQIGTGCTMTFTNTGGCKRDALCYSVTVGATTASCYGEKTVNAGASAATQYHRMYIDPADMSGAPILARGLDNTGATQRWRLAYSAGTVILRNAANTAVFTSSSLSSGTRYRVEWQVAGSTTGACRLFVYVGESTSPTYDSGAGTDNFGGVIQIVRAGVASGMASVSLKFDDFAWSDTAALGPAVKDSGTLAGGLPLGGSYTGVDVPVVPVVTTPTGNLSFAVEAAYGADLTDLTGTTWVWTDITSRVRGDIQITRGRQDRAAAAAPTRFGFRLANNDGWLTPFNVLSPLAGQWGLNTPIRVRLDPGGTGLVVRAQGYVDGIEPVWPSGNSDQAEVQVSCSGALRRLGQGDSARSALRRTITAASPFFYWPLEDGQYATQAASGKTGGTPLAMYQTVRFGSRSGPLGSSGCADFSAGGWLSGPAAFNLFTSGSSTMRVEFAFQYASPLAVGESVPLVGWENTAGQRWKVGGDKTSGFAVTWVASLGTSTGTYTSGLAVDDGVWHWCRVELRQATSQVTVYIDGVQVINQVGGLPGFAYPTQVTVNPDRVTSASSPAVCHLVTSTGVSANTWVSAMSGYPGELADARMTRLCAEADVPLAVTGTSTITMGPQLPGLLVDLLTDGETADQGILRDGLTSGLTFLAGYSRYNPTVTLAMDTARRHAKLLFQPVEDDSRIRNIITAKRPGGGAATVSDDDPLHLRSTVRALAYPGDFQVNVAADAMLPDQAGWQVRLGTVEEMRLPAMRIMPTDTPELITAWLACDLGSRYTLTNPPSQYPGTVDQILAYYVETFDAVAWSVDLTGTPASAWRVLELDTDRLEFDGQNLASGVTTTATSWSIASPTLPLMVTTADAPADFPYYIQCEGEVVQVTGTSGTSSPQTVTVVRSVNGVVKAHNATAAIVLWPSLPLAL